MPRSFNQRPRQDATLAPHPSRMKTRLHIYRNRIPDAEEVAELSAEWRAAHPPKKLPDAKVPPRTYVANVGKEKALPSGFQDLFSMPDLGRWDLRRELVGK